MINDKAEELLTRSLANIETAKEELEKRDHRVLAGELNAIETVIKGIKKGAE